MNETKEQILRKLFDLRCRSKRGEHLSPEDLKFFEKCWSKYPEEYRAMDAEVFKETLPFGCVIEERVKE